VIRRPHRRAPRCTDGRPEPRDRRTVRRARGESGVGLIAMHVGVLVFLALVLGATQVALNLYATSAVTAAAYDAASIAAGADGDVAAAEAHAREVLGRFGDDVTFSWTVDADTVTLHVHARNPSVMMPSLARAVGYDTIDRTVTVRRESFR
jgi:hypothetical protein